MADGLDVGCAAGERPKGREEVEEWLGEGEVCWVGGIFWATLVDDSYGLEENLPWACGLGGHKEHADGGREDCSSADVLSDGGRDCD